MKGISPQSQPPPYPIMKITTTIAVKRLKGLKADLKKVNDRKNSKAAK
jgi:hypothetical protein